LPEIYNDPIDTLECKTPQAYTMENRIIICYIEQAWEILGGTTHNWHRVFKLAMKLAQEDIQDATRAKAIQRGIQPSVVNA